MEDIAEQDYLNWLNTTTNEYRGRFLSIAISVEQVIDMFLAFYFVGKNPDKSFQFQELFLDSRTMPFNQKIKALNKIIKILPVEFDEFKVIIPKLNKLMETRNLFAHSKVDNRVDTAIAKANVRDKLQLLTIKDFTDHEIILDINDLMIQAVTFQKLMAPLIELLGRYERYTKGTL